MLRFWTWLRDFANAQVREAYMRRHFHDRLCPVCFTWISETGGAEDAIREDDEHDLMQCRQCRHWSRWLMVYMLPVLAEKQPVPVVATRRPS